LFRWTGWSLVAPRPGRTLRAGVEPASGVQSEIPEDVKDEAAAGGNGLAVTFVPVKGSLPRLRFGVAYRFRARIVDLAGNSLVPDDHSLKDDENVTDAVTYWRFEPVDPPALLHRQRTSEGESLERMVVRSNWNVDTAAYLGTAEFATAIGLPASADFEYAAENERHVVPPRSNWLPRLRSPTWRRRRKLRHGRLPLRIRPATGSLPGSTSSTVRLWWKRLTFLMAPPAALPSALHPGMRFPGLPAQ
jgi:hypothetical protein